MESRRQVVQSWITEVQQELDPLERLRAAHELRMDVSAVSDLIRDSFLAAQQAGRTLVEIAEVLGMTHEEAEERFGARSAR